jgi:hypothetical protein
MYKEIYRKIPIFMLESAGISTVDIGMCWILPLWILECVGNVQCPCRYTHVGKFCQPCYLVLRHPLYISEFCISPCNSVRITMYAQNYI